MFSTIEYIKKRSGKKGFDRPNYLRELIDEFKSSNNLECQKQVLANVSNFLYDPINHQWLLELGVLDILLNLIQTEDSLQLLAITGLCNFAANKEVKNLILHKVELSHFSSLLISSDEKVLIETLSLIWFLVDEGTQGLLNKDICDQIRVHLLSENSRIKNLSTILLSDFC